MIFAPSRVDWSAVVVLILQLSIFGALYRLENRASQYASTSSKSSGASVELSE